MFLASSVLAACESKRLPLRRVLYQINTGGFERSAQGCFICQSDRDFSVDNLGPSNGCDANFRRAR